MGWLLDSIASVNTAASGELLDIFAKAAVILLAAFAGAYVLRRAAAATRYQLWTAALISVLALPLLSAFLPAWQVPLLPAEMMEAGLEEAPFAPASRTALQERHDSGSKATAATPPAISAPPNRGSAGVEPAPAQVAVPAPSVLASAVALLSSLSWSIWLMGIWMAGTLFLLTRLAVSMVAAWWVTRHAEPLRGSRWAVAARSVQDRLGITSEVALVTSDKTTMPMAWGIFRPRVLLPREAEHWPNERRRVVLLHEMAHLKRRDCQTLLLARLVTALYWINPLVWVANRRMQAERERACDDLVLSAGTRGTDYAQHHLEIARNMRRPTTAGYAAVAMARPSQLEGRLLRILDPSLNRRRATRIASVAGIALVSMLVLPLAVLQPWAEAAVSSPAQNAGGQELERVQDGERQTDRGVQVETDVRSSDGAREAIQEAMDSIDEEKLELAIETAVERLVERDLEFTYEVSHRQADPRVLAALTTALADTEWQIREQAAESLGNLEDPAGIPVLSNALATDESPQVREAAARALGMIEDVSAVPALSAALGDEVDAVREQVEWALGMIEDEAGIAALSTLVSDTNVGVREEAVWALGMIEDQSAVLALTAALDDAAVQVREQAAWSLGMIEDESAVQALATALSDDRAEVRKQAAWALGMIESTDATEHLVAVGLQDDEWFVREQAAWALGMIGDERALDALLDAMSDENLEVRKQALWAVSQISSNSNGN